MSTLWAVEGTYMALLIVIRKEIYLADSMGSSGGGEGVKTGEGGRTPSRPRKGRKDELLWPARPGD